MESSDVGDSMSLSNISRFRHLSSRNSQRPSAREEKITQVEEDSLESIQSPVNQRSNIKPKID